MRSIENNLNKYSYKNAYFRSANCDNFTAVIS